MMLHDGFVAFLVSPLRTFQKSLNQALLSVVTLWQHYPLLLQISSETFKSCVFPLRVVGTGMEYHPLALPLALHDHIFLAWTIIIGLRNITTCSCFNSYLRWDVQSADGFPRVVGGIQVVLLDRAYTFYIFVIISYNLLEVGCVDLVVPRFSSSQFL